MTRIQKIMGPPQGKYKGIVNYHGILVGLEHIAGDIHYHTGKKCDVSYGEIPKTVGVDGDPVDVILGEDLNSLTIYVLQDSHETDSDQPGDLPQYGEDKFAIGFNTEADARAAYADYYEGDNRQIVGCIITDVDEVRERVGCPAEAGLPWFAKSIVSDLIKATKAPKGFAPIPKSKHGGFRKKKTTGSGWTYWYPGQHHHDDHDEWEEDHARGRGVKGGKAGHLYYIPGRRGLFVLTPDARPHKEGQVVLTQYSASKGGASGTPVVVKADKIVAAKGKRKIKRPPTRAKKPKIKTGPGKRPSDLPKKKKKPLVEGEDGRPKSEVYEASTASEGTYLHRLENGHYHLMQVRDDHDGRLRTTEAVDIPEADRSAVVVEFANLIHKNARTVASSFQIPVTDGTGQKSPHYEEVESGAKMGFVLALRAYKGGKPFRLVAKDYVTTYANRAAQQTLSGGGAHIPHRTMQLLNGFIAAKSRATSNDGHEPSDKEIAAEWVAKKKDVFSSGRKLGSYISKDGTTSTSQDSETLPMGDWFLRTPTGETTGTARPGKLEMVRRLSGVLEGGRVYGSDWMERHESGLLPAHTDIGMSAGTAHHVSSEVSDIVTEMTPKNAQVISVLFGLTGDFSEGATKRTDENRMISDEDLSKLMGGKGTRRDGAMSRKSAIREFKSIAREKRSVARQYADHWGRAAAESISTDRTGFGPSHAELKERFGTEERVKLYQVGLRTGSANRIGQILDRDAKGESTPAEMRNVREEYYHQRAIDRLEMFRLQTHHIEVDPSLVRDRPEGTPASADHLYTDEILHNAMHAVSTGILSRLSDTLSSAEQKTRSKVMSDERFARFMGRPAPKEQRQEVTDNG
jgi:hypothetical protein